MSSPASSVDADIQAAFSNAAPPQASTQHIDNDISSAFSEQPTSTSLKPDSPWYERAATGLGHASLEVAGSFAHAAGNLADVVTGTDPGKGSHAEHWRAPFTHAPEPSDVNPTDPKEMIRRGLPKVDPYNLIPKGPLQDTLRERIPQAVEAVSPFLPYLRGVGGRTAEAGASSMAGDAESISAAKSAADLSKASPELQHAYSEMDPATINKQALSRHLEADSLPVEIRLTEGQATGNPDILSNEMNKRGATGLSQFHAQQGQALKDNLQAIRDEAGPEVFSTNPVEHGDTLIQAYKDMDAPRVADISAKYKALQDANGGEFPVDVNQLYKNASQALHKGLLYDHAPKVMGTLGRLADEGHMTFEQFEALRTNLARVQRTSLDGNERAAAGVIRDQMEELPMAPGTAGLKPLADAARGAARARFQAMEADPAYKAAVNETVPPDRFVQKYVIGAPRDQVAQMRTNLADNPTATQTMGVAAVDHLRQAAGIDPMGNGVFRQANYNKALTQLSPKMQSLLDSKQAEHLQSLGNVARYIKEQGEGTTINNSGTLSGAFAQAAGKLGQSVLNVKTGGAAGPAIDWAKGKFNQRALRAELETATAPLAGVSSPASGAAKP